MTNIYITHIIRVYQIRQLLRKKGGRNVLLTPSEYELVRNSFLFSANSKTEEGAKKMNSFLASRDCKILEFSKGEAIFSSEENSKSLGILLRGKAVAASSGEKSSLKIFGSGEVFGAASVFCENKKASFASVFANSACRVLFITREGLKRLLMENPETAFAYITFLSGRVEFLNRRIKTFTSSQATTRLAKYILENESALDCVNFAFLARTLNISRASLYRARNELEKTNSVEFGTKSIKIKNKTELMKVLNKE